MSFYEDISKYYDEIFPLKEKRKAFTLSILPDNLLEVLDIGCATGELSLYLAGQGRRVTGMDLDEKMILSASKKAKESGLTEPPRFLCRDMRRLGRDFPPQSFHAILCFGNTLPHLQGELETRNFLGQCHSLLKPGGKLVLQMVNFDFMMQSGEMDLPLIDTPNISFQRSYEFDAPQYNGRILFSSTLTFKKNNHNVENCIPLYPVSPQRLQELIKDAGFADPKALANETGKPFTSASPSLLLIVEK